MGMTRGRPGRAPGRFLSRGRPATKSTEPLEGASAGGRPGRVPWPNRPPWPRWTALAAILIGLAVAAGSVNSARATDDDDPPAEAPAQDRAQADRAPGDAARPVAPNEAGPAADQPVADDDDDRPAANDNDDDDRAATADNDEDGAADDEGDDAIAAPQRLISHGGVPAIRLDEAELERSGIVTAVAQNVEAPATVLAFASVVDLDPMMELSGQIITARAAVTSAEARLAASRGAYERARSLFENNQVIPISQLQAAEAIFRADEATLLSAQTQLRSSLALARQEWGEVLGKSLEDGSGIASDLMSRKSLLLRLSFPPDRQVSAPPPTAALWLNEGGTADIRLLSRATDTDPRIQGIAFLYVADAAIGLQPGMTLPAAIPLGAPVSGVEVPASSVIWWQGAAWVYTREGDIFSRQRIGAAVPSLSGGFIEKSLPTGAELVVHGAEALLSEEFRSAVEMEEGEGK